MEKLIDKNDLLAFTLSNPMTASKQALSLDSMDIELEDTGILRIEPKQKTSISLVLSAGIHGNETAPLELLNAIVQDILDGRLACSVRVLVIFGNPPASNVAQRFTEINMNRLFSGAWKQVDCWEGRRAQSIEKSITAFFVSHPTHEKLHYDLHTAIRGSKYPKFAVHPFTGEKPYSQQQLAFLAAADIEAVLLSHQPTTTLSYYSYQEHGAQAFTLELGRVAAFGENDLSKLTMVDQALRTLISINTLADSNPNELILFEVIDVLTKDADDYQLNIADDFNNFVDFKAGDCLAKSSLSSYQIKADGDALVFPNTKLPIGQRSGLVVRRIALQKLHVL